MLKENLALLLNSISLSPWVLVFFLINNWETETRQFTSVFRTSVPSQLHKGRGYLPLGLSILEPK